jgi:hypothetical protein
MAHLEILEIGMDRGGALLVSVRALSDEIFPISAAHGPHEHGLVRDAVPSCISIWLMPTSSAGKGMESYAR